AQAPARTKSAARAEPRLPGAIEKAPEWLKTGEPFDVDAFLRLPPEAENAAPLYLDALLEFSPVVANCFPNGAETARRKRVATARERRDQEIAADPNSVPAKQLDAFLAEHELGFRKLAEAQRRPRCAFATGYTFESLLPHAQSARQVVRIVQLRARRDRQRGE